jgi:Amt family ammonium transporter
MATILVVFMNAGFAMLEAGLCRQKNAVNVLSKNLIVFGITTIVYWAFGFSLMFATGNPIAGFNGFFLSSQDPATYGLEAFPIGLPLALFFLFEVAFAGTSATIVSGAIAERVVFKAFLIFSVFKVLSYSVIGHWTWGGGWLEEAGFIDFAGATVVHSAGGWAALVGAVLLGPRLGKYQNDQVQPIPGHNLSLATLGCLILWIGWFGFNGGSELALNENVFPIVVNTNLAAAAGGVVVTLMSWTKYTKPDLTLTINGTLAGLVAITACCNDVSYKAALAIGAVAGILVVLAIAFFDHLKIDDPVGAISVHLVNGIWGTLAVAIFGSHAGGSQLTVQLVGIVAVGGFTALTSALIWQILKLTIGIRVSEEEERLGLDIGEHGMEAYTGFAKEQDMMGGSSENDSY